MYTLNQIHLYIKRIIIVPLYVLSMISRSTIEVYKEAEINRTMQTKDSIIPDTVNQVVE